MRARARTLGQLGQLRAPGLGQAADVELALALVADDHGARAKAAALEVGAGAQRAAARHARVRDDLARAPGAACKKNPNHNGNPRYVTSET
jgi:hypothetical protein